VKKVEIILKKNGIKVKKYQIAILIVIALLQTEVLYFVVLAIKNVKESQV